MIIHFSTSLPSVASQYLECLRHFKEFHLSRKDIQIITATVGKTRCVFRLIWAVFRLVWRSQAAFFSLRQTSADSNDFPIVWSFVIVTASRLTYDALERGSTSWESLD